MRKTVRVLCVAAGALACAWAVALVPRAAAASPPSGISPDTQFTPIVSSVLTRPTAVRGSDGRFHVAYELVLSNTTQLTIRVTGIEVADAGTDRVLKKLSGRTLTANMNPLGGLPQADLSSVAAAAPTAAATTIGGSGTSIVWLDVAVPSSRAVPRTLVHEIQAEAPMPGGRPVTFNGVIGRVATGSQAPIVLAPPVRSGTWVADEGCCTAPTHHRRGLVGVNGELGVAQRFAIDWFLLDAQHRAWKGDPRRLESYPSFGQPELAAAPGVVVSATDGLKDNTPQGTLPELPPIRDTVGNHVILKVAPKRYLLYGHMERGTVRVRVGQRVRTGQLLGLLGNSGNSSTPHLHFQVLTRPTFFPADSPPYRFARFDLLGRITEEFTDEDLALRTSGKLAYAPAKRSRTTRLTLPLDRTVVRFR